MRDWLTYSHRRSVMALAAILSWFAQPATGSWTVDWAVPPSFAQELERPALSPTGGNATLVQVSAELMPDLHRLEKRHANGEIFDLFSSSSAPRTPGRTTGRTATKATGTESGPSGSSDERDADVPDTEPEKDLTAAAKVSPPPVPSVPAPSPTPTVVAPPAVRPIPPAPVVHPAVAASPPPPPAPKPPALAFAYMGKLEEDGRTVYFLVKGDKLYMVKAGEDIDETYSFEGEFGNQLRLTYKPLRIAQLLTIGP